MARNIMLCLGLWWLAVAMASAAAADIEVLAEDLSLYCDMAGADILRCHYRSGQRGEHSLSLSVNGQPLKPRRHTAYPGTSAHTALLLMLQSPTISTHDRYQRLVAEASALLQTLPAHVQIGLATFDGKSEVMLPLGAERGEVERALRQLQTRPDEPTQLYPALSHAIEMLTYQAVDRRVLLVFSDADSPAAPQQRDEVVRQAKNALVAIYAVGFPKSEALKLSLQELDRLSTATGGEAVHADADWSLNSAARDALVGHMESGGMFEVALTNNVAASLKSGQPLLVEVSHRGGARGRALLRFVTPASGAVPGTTPQPAHQSPAGDKGWLHYAVLALGIGLIVAGLLLVFFRRQEDGDAIPPPKPGAVPKNRHFTAWLEPVIDPSQSRYPVSDTITSIGRNNDNDISIDDQSVSRFHAKIEKRTDGTFIISDLNSLNGIYVNDRQVRSALVNDQDRVEVGDVKLKFVLEEQAGDTVLLDNTP